MAKKIAEQMIFQVEMEPFKAALNFTERTAQKLKTRKKNNGKAKLKL